MARHREKQRQTALEREVARSFDNLPREDQALIASRAAARYAAKLAAICDQYPGLRRLRTTGLKASQIRALPWLRFSKRLRRKWNVKNKNLSRTNFGLPKKGTCTIKSKPT